MRERIDGEAAGEPRSGVAERVGGIAVRDLVRDDGKNKDDEGEKGEHVAGFVLYATMR
jgi:hypothetical protein